MTVSIILLGAGLIGRRHAQLLSDHPSVRFAGIVDPDPNAAAFAAQLGVPHFTSLDETNGLQVDGAVIATPNARHAPDTVAAARRGWAVLVEKPVADTVAAATEMSEACAANNVPLLVGHHRRHHPFVATTRKMLQDGAIGRLTLVSILWAVRKHATYFDADWRRQPGAGPVFINLIHEVDLLRHLCGDVTEIRSMTSSTMRGHAVEDTAAVLLRLESGALATIAISDAALSPWSFEAASGENPDIALSKQHSWRIAGTAGALEFPNLHLWTAPGGAEADWASTLTRTAMETPQATPLLRQLDHFVDVVARRAEPLVSGTDASRSLEITERVLAAASGADAQ